MKRLELFDKNGVFTDPTEEDYEKNRLDYIANYEEFDKGGLFTYGKYKKLPEVAKAKWDSRYPNGYDDWLTMHGTSLSPHGQRNLIRHHDKLVKLVNELLDTK